VFAREAASIQLQDALDRASSSETRATEAEARLATEQARYLDADLRARAAEAAARDTQSQLTLQTQGTSTSFTSKHSHPRLTNVSRIPNLQQHKQTKTVASLESTNLSAEQETRSTSNDSCLLLVDDPTSSKCLECSDQDRSAWLLK